MAGDWIKMRCNLWTHPKVVTLSLRLSVTRAHVIGALHGAWSVADQHGACVDMSPESLDALVETPGFTTQLVSVAWLSTDEGKLQFLNYEEHNGATAKARALTHKRVTASRNRNGSVTQQRNKSVTREEKIREDILSLEKKESKKSDTPVDASFDRFWKAYPRKVAKVDARKAWLGAVKAIRKETLCSVTDAENLIERAAGVFAESEKARGEYCPYPATWLNQGRYDDDPSTWKENGHVTCQMPTDEELANWNPVNGGME